jgi:hypothetical protein
MYPARWPSPRVTTVSTFLRTSPHVTGSICQPSDAPSSVCIRALGRSPHSRPSHD